MQKNSWSCVHIKNSKNRDILTAYKLLYDICITHSRKGCFKIKAKLSACSVLLCENNRIHACLSCPYCGCFETHIKLHSREKNHPISMDIDSGQVFCSRCLDYKYDDDFIRIAVKMRSIAHGKRKQRTPKYEPTRDEIDLLQYHDIVYSPEKGIRGILNPSKTICYIIVIIQSFVHAASFRDYLLSLEHKCKYENADIVSCFVCEMYNILQQYFSDQQGILLLTNLLYLVTIRFNSSINKYDDPKVFLMEFLGFLHDDTVEDPDSTEECDCIIHTVFGITLKKKRKCYNCMNLIELPSVVEWFLSLHIEEDNSTEGNANVEAKGKKKKKEKDKSVESRIVSFENCLHRALFEELSDFRCSNCQVADKCVTISIPVLPYVLIFSRSENIYFQNISEQRLSDTFIEFPEVIDMSPFLFKSKRLKSSEYLYYLFGVVEFIPPVHYLCYVRPHPQKWYKVNEDSVDECQTSDVLKIKAYILFYHRMAYS